MNNGIALKIADQWAVLPADTSISITQNSPIWGKSGTFTFEFDLPVEPNRHLIGNANEGRGESIYRAIEGKRAILYAGGLPILFGIIKLDDKVSFSKKSVQVSIVSANLEFDEIIGELKARNLQQAKKVQIGVTVGKVEGHVHFEEYHDLGTGVDENEYTDYYEFKQSDLPNEGGMNNEGFTNVTYPYPQAQFCNVRVCYQHYYTEVNDSSTAKVSTASYDVIEYDRQDSGICFYMLYFLQCVFNQFNIPVVQNDALEYDDLCRVVMLNLQAKYDIGDVQSAIDWNSGVQQKYRIGYGHFGYKENQSMEGPSDYVRIEATIDKVYPAKAYASSENFPDVTVKTLLEYIENGFGIRFIYNSSQGIAQIVVLQKLLSTTDAYAFPGLTVEEPYKEENATQGFKLTYSAEGDEEEDVTDYSRETSYSYSDFSHVIEGEYKNFRKNVLKRDTTCYVDKNTGNSYRIKVNSKAEEEKDLAPSLFEVAQFRHAEYGDCSNDERTETISIGFTPIVMNDVNYRKSMEMGNDESIMAYYLSDIGESMVVTNTDNTPAGKTVKGWYKHTNGGLVQYDYQGMALWFYPPYSWDTEANEDNPITTYDCGVTFGIMRGPGSKARTTDYDQNYDGEGNWKWTTVPGNYALDNDMCDNFGSIYDYNGQAAEGEPDNGLGGDLSKRFSLKLRCEKPKADGSGFYDIQKEDLQNRGLFDRLHSLYAYWVVNRKIMHFRRRMEIAEVMAVDLAKKYNIDGYIGYVNSLKYSVDENGISIVDVELYYV